MLVILGKIYDFLEGPYLLITPFSTINNTSKTRLLTYYSIKIKNVLFLMTVK